MSNENLFTDMSSVYKNRSVLSEDYQPEAILEREDEKQAYGAALSPILNGGKPNNIFVYGNTGVGKTAVTRYMFRQLDDRLNDEDKDFTVVWQNCRNQTTSYQVAVSLVNELAPRGEEIPETGYAPPQVYNMLFDLLDDAGGTILVVLDEVDAVGSDDDLLYELPRARAEGNLKDAHVGVVGISNDYQFRGQLSPQVQDTLCEKEITFPAYDATELQTILTARAKAAFDNDAYDEAIIPQAAAMAAKDSGSARQGLDLLREAGDLAAEEERVIDEETVREAVDRLERTNVRRSVQDLTNHARLALISTTLKTVEEKERSRTKNIYEKYAVLAEENGDDPLGYRSFQNRLNDLSMMGFLDRSTVNKGERGGKSYTYSVTNDPDVILDAVSELNY